MVKTGWNATRVIGLRWPVNVQRSGGRGIQSPELVTFLTGALLSSSCIAVILLSRSMIYNGRDEDNNNGLINKHDLLSFYLSPCLSASLSFLYHAPSRSLSHQKSMSTLSGFLSLCFSCHILFTFLNHINTARLRLHFALLHAAIAFALSVAVSVATGSTWAYAL